MAKGSIGPCTGEHPLVKVVAAAEELGHKLWAAAVTGTTSADTCCPMAVCGRCGSWTFGSKQAGRSKLATEECKPPTKAGKAALARIRSGKYPKAEAAYKACQVVGLAPWPTTRIKAQGAGFVIIGGEEAQE